MAADWLNVQSADLKVGGWKLRDAYKVLLGGHYKFEPATVYGTVQYMKNIAYIGGYATKEFAPVTAEQNTSAADGKVGENKASKRWRSPSVLSSMPSAER